MKLQGEVRDGRLVIAPVQWAIAMNEFANRRVVVEITKEKRARTNSQNSYYWGCVLPIIAHILTEEIHKTIPDAEPVTDKEAHQSLKKKFLGKEIVGGLEIIRSTTSLSTIGFSDYVELCRQFASEAGFYIPSPGEPLEVIA